MTHRQFLAWLDHEEEKWDERDKLTHYLAALLAEVRRGWVKEKDAVEPVYLRFTKEQPADPKDRPTKEEHERNLDLLGRGAWIASLGGKVEHRRVPRGDGGRGDG